jgi:hypothetical protein
LRFKECLHEKAGAMTDATGKRPPWYFLTAALVGILVVGLMWFFRFSPLPPIQSDPANEVVTMLYDHWTHRTCFDYLGMAPICGDSAAAMIREVTHRDTTRH